ncbi:hypothetical protein [Flavobacterium branchiicola]|uniref:Uncharacterized protein n=1 Tax=Flavobacterium branchiicola TaxID=1114875 RepID=A0ABV9PG00_9FLAO|nr:hypothetical protein [Flavobacterium branchiicola]MBS7253999.1 hypothetical protein [Flavobacterium branchiicola]
MKLAYILFLQICLLTIPNSYSNSIVKRINSHVATESVQGTLTEGKAKYETTLLESSQLKFILLENTSETEKCSTSLPVSPLHLNSKNSKDICFVCTESIKLNNQGVLERNIPPFRNMSRNILFHSLKIHL